MKRAISFVLVGISYLAFSKGIYSANDPHIISAVLERPALTDRIQKTSMTFNRDSIAYTLDGREVPNGNPRFQKLAIFNRPEYTITETCSNTNIVVLAYYDGCFWGAQPWYNLGKSLYQSSDAVNWEAVANVESRQITSIYVTETGLLLVGTRFPGGVCIWDPNSESLVRVLTMLSEDPYPKHWSWAEMNGTVYVGEYGYKYGSNNARRIYQSLDGGWNWEVLYDPEPVDGYHVHKVLADPYRSHIYWAHGDAPSVGAGSGLFRSTDLGQTWQLISNVEQPTAGIARPHGVYFGADSGGAGIYRFLDGSEKGEFVCTALTEGYIWDMQDFNGIIYATSLNHEHWGPPSVVISKDGEHWGNLYQWETGISGLERFACEVNDIIYAVMEEYVGDVATMFFAAPTIRTSWGVVVESDMENLLANSCNSSFEGCTKTSWSNFYYTAIEVSSERAHSGNNSLKVSNTSGSAKTMRIYSPVIYGDFPAGTVVSATVQISGWNQNVTWIYVKIRDETNNLVSAYELARTGTGWSKVPVYWRLPQNSTSLSVEIGTWSATSETIFYVDSVALTTNSVPISFQTGGQERAAETLSHHVAFPSCWTDVFCWQPPYSPGAVDKNMVVKSWSVEDSNSWMQLVIDETRNFKLEEVKGDLTKTLASVSAPDFLPESLIRFAVVQDVNEIALHILCPQGWLLTTGSRTEVCPAIVFFGSAPDGTMQAGGLYSNARVYDAGMTSEQINHVINEIAEQGWLLGDMDGDGDIDFSDLLVLVENWLHTGCDCPDWCSHADMDMNRAVDFSDFANFAGLWHDGCE